MATIHIQPGPELYIFSLDRILLYDSDEFWEWVKQDVAKKGPGEWGGSAQGEGFETHWDDGDDTGDVVEGSAVYQRARAARVLRYDDYGRRVNEDGEVIAVEYSPDQPRAPEGTPDGGQWVSAGGEPQSATDVGTSSTGLNERGLSAVRQIITDRRQGKVEWHDDEHGDEMLGAAQRAVGYADTPKIVSATEFDRMVSDDEMKVLYRGERKEQYVQDWKRGELYTGKGVYGNGTYTAVSVDSAKKYTGLDGDKALFRIGLPRTAKIIDNDALDDEMQAFERKLRATDKYLFNTPTELHAVIQEPGLYATLAGYDAIVARRGTYYVILNRAICFVTAEEPWNRS